MAVAAHGERVTAKGLVFAATPASDFICGTQQLASMNLHVFTTGEGSPYGLALVPVIKVSSRTALAEKWADLIDLDAGRIATGHATIEDVGWELFRLILDVASGRKQDVGGALGPAQRACALQSGTRDLEPGPNRLCLQRRGAENAEEAQRKAKTKPAGEGEVAAGCQWHCSNKKEIFSFVLIHLAFGECELPLAVQLRCE